MPKNRNRGKETLYISKNVLKSLYTDFRTLLFTIKFALVFSKLFQLSSPSQQRVQNNPTRYHTKQVLSLFGLPMTIVERPSMIAESVVVLKSIDTSGSVVKRRMPAIAPLEAS